MPKPEPRTVGTSAAAFRSTSTVCDEEGAQDRYFCGLRVASTFPLKELKPWTGDDRRPDLVVDLGSAPQLSDAVVNRPFLQVDPAGMCRFEVPGVAVWRVTPDGRRVTVDTSLDPASPSQRTFLYGTVFAIVALRRGLLPLHAACLHLPGGAVAFAGPSGIGKSTLAARMLMRGYPLLSDDVTMVSFSTAGGPQVLPALPRIRLWQDSLDQLGLSSEGLQRTRPVLEKFSYPVDGLFHAASAPLRALVLLSGSSPRQTNLRRLPLIEALQRAGEILYRPLLMRRLGMVSEQMLAVPRLLSSLDGCYTVSRPNSEADLDALIASLGA